MSDELELADWRQRWQGRALGGGAAGSDAMAVAKALQQRVLHQTRQRRTALIVPLTVTVLVGGAVLFRALGSDRRLDTVLAIEAWVFIAFVWASSLWTARGTWQPLGESTLEFLRLAMRRCRASIHGAWLGVALYVVQLVAVVVLRWHLGGPETSLAAILGSWPVIVIGWIGLPVYVGAMFWFVARKRTELARYDALERELGSG